LKHWRYVAEEMLGVSWRPIFLVPGLSRYCDLEFDLTGTKFDPDLYELKKDKDTEIGERIFSVFGFKDFTHPPSAEIVGERQAFGLTIRRFRLNKKTGPTRMPQGIDILVNEIVDTTAGIENFEFEILYNIKRHPIAIFPVISDQIKSIGIAKARLRYFDLSAYYFDIRTAQPDYPQARQKWLALKEQARMNR
jgi:hypothetical protein